MAEVKYRVVLTGELIPGHTVEGASQGLARVFNASPDSLRVVFRGGMHPIKRPFSADGAIAFQERLERLGVRSRVEKMPIRALDLDLRDDVAQDPAASSIERSEWIRCPACSHHQPPAHECVACGAVLRDDLPNREQPRRERASAAPRPPAPSPEQGGRPSDYPHPREQWRDPEEMFEEDRGLNVEELLQILVGPSAPYYARRFSRMHGPNGIRLRLSWNWMAFLQPCLWSLSRKLWFSAALTFVPSLLAPMVLVIVGLDLEDPWGGRLFWLGWLVLFASMTSFAIVANFLYARRLSELLRQFTDPSMVYATEMEVAMAGGLSRLSLTVGVVMTFVLWLFLSGVLGSLTAHPPPLRAVEEPAAAAAEPGAEPKAASAPESKPETPEPEAQNPWVETRARLRRLGQKVNEWMAVRGNRDASQVNLFTLREELKLGDDELLDAWGSELQYIAEVGGYRIISAGPDRLYGTSDDLTYRRLNDQ